MKKFLECLIMVAFVAYGPGLFQIPPQMAHVQATQKPKVAEKVNIPAQPTKPDPAPPIDPTPAPSPTPDPMPEPEPTPPPVVDPPPPPIVSPVTDCGSDSMMAYIYQHESGCRTNAVNAGSGAYGLCQALPGYKMATAGSDWQTNWATQNAWCIGYANTRYGSPYNAYLFWTQNHWW